MRGRNPPVLVYYSGVLEPRRAADDMSVARGAIAGVAGQVWQLGAAFVLYSFLARQLGPERFGEWRVVLSVLAWFVIFLSSGIADVAAKAIAERPADERFLGRAAYLGQLALAAVILVVMLVLAGPLAAALGEPELAGLIRIASLDVPFQALFMTAVGILLGRHQFERQAVALAVYATAKLVAISALVVMGFGVAGALVGGAVATAVGFAVTFRPLVGAKVPLAELRPHVRSLATLAPAFVGLNLIEGAGQSVDLWLVSATVTSAAAIGWYASALVLADIPLFLFIGLTRIVFPSTARVIAEGRTELASRYTAQSVRIGILVTMLALAIAVGAGKDALELLYSARYVGAYLSLTILMVAAVGRAVREACTNVLMVQNRQPTAISVLLFTVLGEVALLAVLAPRFGIAGAAAAAAVGALLGGAWSAWEVRALLGRQPLATLGRSAIAAAAVAFLMSRIELPAPWVVLTAAGGTVLYLVALALLREFSAQDVASLRDAVRSRRGQADG